MSGATGFSQGNRTPRGYSQGQLQQFTPEQMQLFQSLFSQVGPQSYTSRLAGGDQSLFEEMERPALRQFGELQGNLASRFSGMGGAGSLSSRRSSGFSNTMNQATSDFASGLQSRRQELQRQAIRDLLGMSEELLGQRPYEQFLVKNQKKPSFFQQLAKGALPLAGAGIGFALGGPAGAAIGGRAGGMAGQAFG
jgi:hypothetical protein